MQMEESEAVSEQAMEHGRQVGQSVAEDEYGTCLRGADQLAHETADDGVLERPVLALGIEAAEQMTQPRRVLNRLVLGAYPFSPSLPEIRVQEGRPRPRKRERKDDGV